MALFKYHPSRVAHFSEESAREAVEAQERERAAAPADKSSPAPKSSPAQKPAWKPDLDALSEVDKSDPFLRSLALAEQRAAKESAGPPEGKGTDSSTPVAGHNTRPGTGTKDLSPAVYTAVQFLSEALSDSKPHPASSLLAQAQKKNITEATLRRARLVIGATTEKVGKEWLWQLPSE